MSLSAQQLDEMLIAARPLIKWLNENCHPHVEATVDLTTVSLQETQGS